MYNISPWLVFIKGVFFVRDEQRPKKNVDHPHIATQDDRYFSISEIWIVIDGKSVVTKQMETRKVYCELYIMWKGTFRTYVSSLSFLKTVINLEPRDNSITNAPEALHSAKTSYAFMSSYVQYSPPGVHCRPPKNFCRFRGTKA
jgi:hypothetical protein